MALLGDMDQAEVKQRVVRCDTQPDDSREQAARYLTTQGIGQLSACAPQ